jgi:hypothetical protein
LRIKQECRDRKIRFPERGRVSGIAIWDKKFKKGEIKGKINAKIWVTEANSMDMRVIYLL